MTTKNTPFSTEPATYEVLKCLNYAQKLELSNDVNFFAEFNANQEILPGRLLCRGMNIDDHFFYLWMDHDRRIYVTLGLPPGKPVPVNEAVKA